MKSVGTFDVKQLHFHYHVMFDMLRNLRFVNMYYAHYLHKVIPITFISHTPSDIPHT